MSSELSEPSEHESEEDGLRPDTVDSHDVRRPNAANAASQKLPVQELDPKVTGAVLLCSILALCRPSLLLLVLLVMGNLILAFVVATLCMYLRGKASPAPAPLAAVGDPHDEDGDIKAPVGLQQLLSPGWIRMREIIAQRDFQGVVKAVDLGDQPPEVTFVQSANAPCDDVVCFNVGLLLSSDCNTFVPPTVLIEVKLPGYSTPWTFRLKLLSLQITVQLYFWSWPPEGWGSGRPFSLIEGALCPEANPPLVRVALEAVSKSSLFEQFLSGCEPVASAVICSHVLPRFTGFQNRVILEEGRAQKKAKDSKAWQQKARRAGWQPRAEAAVESVRSSAIQDVHGRTCTRRYNAIYVIHLFAFICILMPLSFRVRCFCHCT